jgi:predicted TIM-barrel fold metal-dependent hydrolase
MSSKFPWLKLGKKTDPELPLEPPVWFGNRSNGEYFHEQTPREARMREEILKRSEREAKRHGMDRREFLASSMGMAVTMTVINEMGCASGSKAAAGDAGAGEAAAEAAAAAAACGNGGFAMPGPTSPYVVTPDACKDPSAVIPACDDFIFDVQTHCFDSGEWRTRNIVYPTFLNFIGSCADETNKLDCFSPQHYAELMFVDSDTTMTVITSWPAAQCFPDRGLIGNPPSACGLPLSNESMRVLRDWINAKSMSQRCINQVQVMPNDFLERQVEGMYAAMADPNWKCGSWKAYPAWTSDTYRAPSGNAQGYYLTDPVGIAFIQAGLKLGVPNFAIHKGLPIPGFNVVNNQPWDIGPIAKMFPQANFVIYHSAIHAGTGSSPTAALSPTPTEMIAFPGYNAMNTPADPTVLPAAPPLTGVNQLIQSLLASGVIADPDKGEPFKAHNVYAEMGSAWSNVMTDTMQSQHYIGKLLKYLGPNNMCWGTDCILGGSPQNQIELFRAFQITPQFQQMYGYPAITPAMKAQIFGLNAAKLYHVDPKAARCSVNSNSFAQIKRELDGQLGDRRWAVKPPLGPRTVQEFFAHAREMRAKGIPG